MKKWIVLFALFLASFHARSALHYGAFNIRNFDYNSGSGGVGKTDKRELTNLLIELNADLFSVEEIKNKEAFGQFLATNFPEYDYVLSECGGSGEQHLGFVYNKNLVKLMSFEEDRTFSDPVQSVENCGSLRPLGVATFKNLESGELFYAVAVHLKAGGDSNSMAKRAIQYKMLVDKINLLRSKSIKKLVMMGDFNTTGFLDQNTDYDKFQEMVSETKLTNMTEDLPCSVYWSDKTYEKPSKLDHILMSRELASEGEVSTEVFSHCKKLSCETSYAEQLGVTYLNVSDHCPFKAVIE